MAAFDWKRNNNYPDKSSVHIIKVKKELKGHYPKHLWPDAWNAIPTRKTKGRNG
ncbi:MAG TPA: hypothetical protein PKO34_08425 [Smithellaceae bacterium]|nr:hypothetical protein [Smithellaceae bacterium]